MWNRKISVIVISFVALLLFPESAHAYIGPGAGFAFLGSAFVFILTFCMALITVLFWPLMWVWRRICGKRISRSARTRRVIILGLDGLDPKLLDKYIGEGKLPNFKSLAEEGCYSRLQTTLPSLSPVAWSTFQTGVNPGAHNIYDFLSRDKRFCFPELSSTRTTLSKKRFSLGSFSMPVGRPDIQLLRKSQPFWRILSKKGVFSSVLRVPISYPPEKFGGNILSAMSTPDLKGTQGTFSLFSSSIDEDASKPTGGEVRELIRDGAKFSSYIEGPPSPYSRSGEALRIPFTLSLFPEREEALLEIGGEKELLRRNQFSRWIRLEFRYGLFKKVTGICHFCLRELQPEVSLYMSPINIDPQKPVLPISCPSFFSMYLAKRNGLFGTLGFMEDTWGLNEQALDDQRFLDQTYLVHEEREKMFLDALDKTREGTCICVFDASDRVQHMFWRYLEDSHPAPREEGDALAQAIPDMYQRMDALLAKTRERVRENDVLMVLSDHGFTSFRRCVNINAWLEQEGYLVRNGDSDEAAEYFQGVDWTKTKAFGIGLSGIFLNRIGRESRGILDDSEAEVVKAEIISKLDNLKDPQGGVRAIRKVYDTAKVYRGAYVAEAPDLIVGYEPGYRVSWESVTGKMRSGIFEDNVKAWSGDHGVDPAAVPGIFLSNRQLSAELPHIRDIAPTVLDLFSVKVPTYMEGKVLI